MKKYKPKDLKTTLLIIAVAVVAVIAAKAMGFSSTHSATRIMYSSSEGWSNWSASYFMLDGTMEKTVHTEDGMISISVVTESGSISVEIRDSDGNVVFDQDDMQSGSYTVSAEQKVTVRIEADHHKGSFLIED